MPLTHIPPPPTSEGLDIYADVDGQIWARSPVTGYGQILGEGGGGPEIEGRTDYGVGLTKTGRTVNLDPANTNNEIGGVMVNGRSDVEGLSLVASGLLSAPLATDGLAGAILESPSDDKKYVRTRTVAGISTWVEMPPGAGVYTELDPPVGAVPDSLWWDTDEAKLYLFYCDSPSGAQTWIQIA